MSSAGSILWTCRLEEVTLFCVVMVSSVLSFVTYWNEPFIHQPPQDAPGKALVFIFNSPVPSIVTGTWPLMDNYLLKRIRSPVMLSNWDCTVVPQDWCLLGARWLMSHGSLCQNGNRYWILTCPGSGDAFEQQGSRTDLTGGPSQKLVVDGFNVVP